jgi:3-mercaptopyruvate sulfurtransferase SseA
VALQLKKLGIDRVRPLAGGIERWHDLNYPTEASAPAVPKAMTAAEQNF